MLSTLWLERKPRVPATPKAVDDDEPLDEKSIGCTTCETIIRLSEEYRLTDFCGM